MKRLEPSISTGLWNRLGRRFGYSIYSLKYRLEARFWGRLGSLGYSLYHVIVVRIRSRHRG
jgi:hypothetical protein